MMDEYPVLGPIHAANPFQGTPEWLAQRCGCLTSSRMADALAFSKAKGRAGEPLKARLDYAKELVAERMTDVSVRRYVSPSMEWGTAYEAEARAAYEARSGDLVQLTGFHLHPTIEFWGGSPDGLIDHDGMVEIKAPETATHLEYIAGGVVPEDYIPQMLSNLALTRRAWCDFVSYDPRIKQERSRLFVRRYTPTAEAIAEMEVQAAEFLRAVDAIFNAVVGA